MKAFLFFYLWVCSTSWAILPLPYPTEPFESSEPAAQTERDPRSVQGLSELYSGSQLREMELPHFENPSNTLGYIEGTTFRVPVALRTRVDFWKKIYTEYNSSQAVLHDAKDMSMIYGVVDLSPIESNAKLSKRQKRRQINRLLRDEKKLIVRQLLELDSYRDRLASVPLSLFPLFKLFERHYSDDKFLRAVANIRAQVGQKDRIVQGFLYGGRYFSQMMDIFEGYNLPKELTRMTLVESGFDLNAVSKVGASGVWQFMRSTGKRFLRIDRAVDERNDPILATQAAAQLLRKNYDRLQSWPLAITAYNHGREGMARAVTSLESTDIAVIIDQYRSKTFGFASSNFYPSFLAIIEIERDYRKYFGKLLVDSPVNMKRLSLNEPMSLKELSASCQIKPAEMGQYNRALTNWVVSGRAKIPTDYQPRVPAESVETCLKGLGSKASLVDPAST